MANHASALKRDRQNKKRRMRNQIIKSMVKTSTKKLLTAIEEKKIEDAQTLLKNAIKMISKASSKGVFHKRKASRKISRLTKKVNALTKS